MLVPLLAESYLEKNHGAEDGLLNAIRCIIQWNFETIPAWQYILISIILNPICLPLRELQIPIGQKSLLCPLLIHLQSA